MGCDEGLGAGWGSGWEKKGWSAESFNLLGSLTYNDGSFINHKTPLFDKFLLSRLSF